MSRTRSASRSWRSWAFVFLTAVVLPAAAANSAKIEIAVTPKKESGDAKQKGQVAHSVTDFQYSVKLTNRSFADVSGLRAEYRIFVLDDSGKGSTSRQKRKKKSFETAIPEIANNATYTFLTEPVKLESTTLDGGWHYNDGKRNKSADKVAGVWIRIFQGDKVVGEYVNPSTLATKETF